jgi:hypothetical protein
MSVNRLCFSWFGKISRYHKKQNTREKQTIVWESQMMNIILELFFKPKPRQGPWSRQGYAEWQNPTARLVTCELSSAWRVQLKFKAAVCAAMIVTLSLQHNAPALFSDCPTFRAQRREHTKPHARSRRKFSAEELTKLKKTSLRSHAQARKCNDEIIAFN